MSLANIPELFILSRSQSKIRVHSLSGIQDLLDIFKEEEARKYLQIDIIDEKQEKLVIVVGSQPADFDSHDNVGTEFSIAIQNQKLWKDYLGGGRIELRDNALIVYDTSKKYGKADHEKTARILREYFQKIGLDIEVKTTP